MAIWGGLIVKMIYAESLNEKNPPENEAIFDFLIIFNIRNIFNIHDSWSPRKFIPIILKC